MEHSPRESRICNTCRAQRPALTNKKLAPARSRSIGPNFLALVSSFVANGSRTASQILSDDSEGCLKCVIREHLRSDARARHSPVLRLKHVPEADMLALRRRRSSRVRLQPWAVGAG
jgi:hypothetical protein